MLDPESIVKDANFLNTEVVGLRNHIAHGSSVLITPDRLQRVIDFVLDAMRSFRNEVDNSVALKKYERAVS